MRRIFYLLLIVSITTRGQNSKMSSAINFQKFENWQQLLTKAKNENKYIFLDCFASWCKPCKYMDKEIYTKDTVGSILNNEFISVKVQIDTPQLDNIEAKKYYALASYINKKYKIDYFPTFLFFSPEGELLHKGIGAKNLADFLELIYNAYDPEKQYYTLLKKYLNGCKDYKQMRYLSILSKNLYDTYLADSISKEYIDYLVSLPRSELFTASNLQFIASFLRSSKDRGFELFYRNNTVIDSLTTKGFATKVADFIISKEEILPILKSSKQMSKLKWEQCRKKIQWKYGSEYSNRIIINSKVRYYRSKEHWDEYIRNLVVKVEKYGSFGIGIEDVDLNNNAWDVFTHSNNKGYLKIALSWCKRVISLKPESPNAYDTYANILYKLGQQPDAILWEEKALNLAHLERLEEKVKEYKDVLSKMKMGIPTWLSH